MPARGLTEEEAARRLSARPPHEPATSRSYASIVRANVFTVFNLILARRGAATLVFGEWQDALFLGVLVVERGDRDHAGGAREAGARPARRARRAERDGRPRRARARRSVEEVVVGRPRARPGRATRSSPTGSSAEASGLALDESILTGESRPVAALAGEERALGLVRRRGRRRVRRRRRSASESYAARIAGEARDVPPSALAARAGAQPPAPRARRGDRAARDRSSATRSGSDARRSHEAVPTSVAAVVTLVPEGLILLASLTYAVAALRMARRGALAQQLNAIESLASVDVVCLDKTGTLTEPRLAVLRLLPAEGVDEDELAARARPTTPPRAPARNATLEAIADGVPAAADAASSDACRSRRGAASARVRARRTAGSCSARRSCSRSARSSEPRRHEAAAGRRVVAFGDVARTGSRRRSARTTAARSGSSCSPSGCGPRRARRSSSSGARASS